MNGELERCATCGCLRSPEGNLESSSAGRRVDASMHLTGRMMQVPRLATVGEMASCIAHELNQPLAAIANYAQASSRVLKSANPEIEDVHLALDEIATQAVRAVDIIRRMRDLARRDEVERQSENPNALIEEMAEVLLADARAHGAELRLNLTPDLPRVLIHRVQIQHVLLNLTRNALEALMAVPASQREIVIGTALLPDNHVEISVSDNGPGLPAAVICRWLEPFLTTRPFGTGLGLTISNTIVQAHEGIFGYRANVPSGACLYIHIPMIQEAHS